MFELLLFIFFGLVYTLSVILIVCCIYENKYYKHCKKLLEKDLERIKSV